MSIGETDKIWWQKIGAWLLDNNNNRLVICYFKKKYSKAVIGHFLDSEKEAINQFITQADIAREFIDTIKKQIVVIVNSEIFKS